MKALVGAFNQEKALVGAFSVIVNIRIIFVSSCNCHGLSAALNCGLPLCGERFDFYFGLKMCSLMIYLIETINGWTEKILKVLVVK